MQVVDTFKQNMKKMNTKSRIAITVLAVLLFAGISFSAYAKYYKTSYNQGIAIASGFYFNSKFMCEEENINDLKIEELAKKEEIVSQLTSYVSNKPWNGNDFTLSIDVRNYANQLLYNDKDLDISYKVDFILLDEGADANGTYEVRPENSTSYTKITNSKAVGFEGKLEGGQAIEDKYELKVTLPMTGSADYKPARILIMAYPEDIASGKIAGIVKVDYNQAEMEIIDQKFTIEDELQKLGDDKWMERVKEESAFVYQLKTTGGYYVEGGNNMMQKIKITWNPDLFVLNQNDRYINEESTEYSSDQGEMIIETAPYSSIKFVFFKKGSFDETVKDMTLEAFTKESVKVDIINAEP